MKKFCWLLPLSILLYACPYESKVPLAAHPVEPVDTSLYGYWYGIIKDFSDMYGIEALDISYNTDSTYKITRYGKAMKGVFIMPDTAYYTGYTSYIGEQRFMNIKGTVVLTIPRRKKQPEYRKVTVYYLAAIDRSHDTLTVKTITDGFSDNKMGFQNPVDLKNTVTALMGEKNIYDKDYTLSYRKIQRPAPAKNF